jgi:hypothetical protein
LRSQLGRAAASAGVAAVIAYYLVELLELTPEQWRWFLIVMGLYTLACSAFAQFTLARVDGPIRDAVGADAAGGLDGERLRRGFAAAVRFPVHGIFFTLASWVGAGVIIPALMLVRYPDFPAGASVAVFVFMAGGGVSCAVFTYLLDRRMVDGLRDRWASRLRDPAERQQLVRPLTLGRKLRVSMTGLILSTALLAAVASDMLSRRPIEAYATRIQTGYLERMATRLDGPGDPIMHIAREDLEELRIGAELIVVNRHDGSIADGPEDALTESERAEQHGLRVDPRLRLGADRGRRGPRPRDGDRARRADRRPHGNAPAARPAGPLPGRGGSGMGALPGPRRRHDRLTPAQ